MGDILVANEHDDVKFLGLHLDENLNWRSHCDALVSKLSTYKHMFYNLRSVLKTRHTLNRD